MAPCILAVNKDLATFRVRKCQNLCEFGDTGSVSHKCRTVCDPNSPLAVVAALGDGVELLRPVVTLVSHGLLMASWGPLPVFLHLRAAASFLVSF